MSGWREDVEVAQQECREPGSGAGGSAGDSGIGRAVPVHKGSGRLSMLLQ